MLQGFYTAASGMLMQQRHLNTISSNLANAQTSGYRAKHLVSTTFEQELLTRLERHNIGGLGTGEPVRIVDEVVDLWSSNGVTESNRPFDMAITGYGFFNVRGEDGQTYLTRDGQFDLDDEGYLISRGRGQVLGANGAPIRVVTSDINVDADGNITNSATGAAIGQLLITQPTENAVVEEARNAMYTATATEPVPAPGPGVINGAYENSNVNLTNELSAMIMTQRNFSTASQALQFIDQTYAKAVNIASL